MSLSTRGMFGAGKELSPFHAFFEPIDPFTAFAEINRPMSRTERRKQHKMLSGNTEDDKPFLVSHYYISLFRVCCNY